jgi:hypothetical protein
MGIFNIANSLPQSVAPAVAPFLLALGGSGGNYTALFVAGMVFCLIGAVLIAPIRAVR